MWPLRSDILHSINFVHWAFPRRWRKWVIAINLLIFIGISHRVQRLQSSPCHFLRSNYFNDLICSHLQPRTIIRPMLAKSYQNIICKTFLIHVVGWWNSAISLSSVVIVGGVIESNFLRSVILWIIRHCRNIHLVIDYHIHISQVPSQFTCSDTITVTS